MVFFICNHCGESLKKQVVANHSYRCNRAINVSCMDCQKDFKGQAYDAHTVCISEAEKYSAKGYVAKVTKGVKKQESWITTVRSIPERHKGLSRGIMSVFEIIERNDNIPRKMQAFMNFFSNSNRCLNMKDVQMAWSLIEKEVKAEKQQTPAQTNGQKTETNVPAQNGTTGSEKNGETQKVMEKEEAPVKQKKKKTKPSSENNEAPVEKKQKKSKDMPANNPEPEEPQPTKQKKRKTKDALGNANEEEESHSSKQKKRKTKDSSQNGNENGTALLVNDTNGAKGNDSKTEEQEQQNGSEEKFNLSEVIREFLTAQNNQMKLSKLKKKVMKRYQQAIGEEVDGKFEKKFQKKIAKTGFVVENDTVRLVEA